MESATATLITFIGLFQSILVTANFEYICKDDLVFRPYLKIYDTKPGDILMEEGPGFYEVGHLNNIYVCINGPVVLYFTRYSSGGDVYDEARNTLDVHRCQYYNGEQGPGPFRQADHLKAILLLGDERDYRLPFVQTFTAPLLLDENTGAYRNVTSVITLGASQCTLYRNPDGQPITFNYLDDKSEESMCRLAYQTIDRWVGADPSTLPGAANTTKDSLTNDVGIVKGECITDEPSTKWVQSYNDMKAIQVEVNRNKTAIITATPTDQASAIQTKQGVIKGTEGIIKDPNTDAATLNTKKTELAKQEAQLVHLQAQQLLWELNKKIDDAVLADKFTRADGLITTRFTTNLAEMDGWKEKGAILYKEFQNRDPSDKDETGRLLNANKLIVNGMGLLYGPLEEDFKKALPAVQIAEEALQQVQVLLNLYELALKEVELAKTAEDSHTTGPVIKYSSDEIDKLKLRSQRIPERIAVNIYGNSTYPTAATTPNATDICLPIQPVGTPFYRVEGKPNTVDGTCYHGKGTKLFGCQLLKARLGDHGICALKEVDADNEENVAVPVPDTLPATAYLPQHMVDVLNLINEIYKKACDRIRPVFAERVNNLLQCYLIRDRVKKNQTSTNGPTPGRVDFWNKIIIALQECRDTGHALKFVRESPEVAKYYLKKNGDFIEVPFLKEQAENEYGFNFAIDMSWKVFATVLGLCMPSYESKIPLITTRFFTMFTEEFLQPIEEHWMSEKDNNVYRRIMSYYYGVGGFETWATYCMEASFLYSSDVSYRPPRKLPVNGRAESNYFVKNKLKKKKRK